MNLIEELSKYPRRIKPKILISKLNDPIKIPVKGLALTTKKDTKLFELDGGINFIWFPQSVIEFYGTYNGEILGLIEEETTLIIKDYGQVPVIITSQSCNNGYKIRGILNDSVVRKTESNFDKLTFYLANFPEYIGAPIINENSDGVEVFSGRIIFENNQWSGMLDSIPENNLLRKEQKKIGGFYISHVGEIRLKNGHYLDEEKIKSIVSDLRYLFGFCSGSWVGPLFPKGSKKNKIGWEQLAPWFVGSAQKVYSWFPTKKRINRLSFFSGFMEKIKNPIFSLPLRNAISWYIEANRPEISNYDRIILLQVALEMLSWTYFVDFKQEYISDEFDKLTAQRKIRKFLYELNIPTVIPNHLRELSNISKKILHTDAPGTLTFIRNALVHPNKDNRKSISSLNGIHLYQVAQMGINLIELSILALCDYDGIYAQRGWIGWKGEDERIVPWVNKPKMIKKRDHILEESKINDYKAYEEFLINEIEIIENMFDLYIYLYNKRIDKQNELNIAPAFFGLSGIALLETSLIKLCNLLESNENTINIEKYLDIIEQIKLDDFNNDIEIEESLRTHRYDLEEKKDKINKLKIIRDKHLAHNDKQIIKGTKDIYREANLLNGEIHELIYWVFDVINKYRIIKGEPSIAYEAINKYDVDYVLGAISEHIDKYYNDSMQ